jgi:hypothetical protein
MRRARYARSSVHSAIRSSGGSPAAQAKDFSDLDVKAREFGEITTRALEPAMRGIGVVGFGASHKMSAFTPLAAE